MVNTPTATALILSIIQACLYLQLSDTHVWSLEGECKFFLLCNEIDYFLMHMY